VKETILGDKSTIIISTGIKMQPGPMVMGEGGEIYFWEGNQRKAFIGMVS
jgi:hypothetical protein